MSRPRQFIVIIGTGMILGWLVGHFISGLAWQVVGALAAGIVNGIFWTIVMPPEPLRDARRKT